MSSSFIAKRYAKALLKITEGNGPLADKALAFLSVCDALFVLPETKKILRSPVMPADLKKALLAYAAEKSGAPQEFVHFTGHVVDAGRTSHLPEISKAFKEMLSEERGIAVATALTADAMSEVSKTELSSVLEKIFKKKITLQNVIEKGVLGGVVVNVGNYTIDLSLKNRLNSVADFARR
jgi:F-type H+-transporting ATPase subunit delta